MARVAMGAAPAGRAPSVGPSVRSAARPARPAHRGPGHRGARGGDRRHGQEHGVEDRCRARRWTGGRWSSPRRSSRLRAPARNPRRPGGARPRGVRPPAEAGRAAKVITREAERADRQKTSHPGRKVGAHVVEPPSRMSDAGRRQAEPNRQSPRHGRQTARRPRQRTGPGPRAPGAQPGRGWGQARRRSGSRLTSPLHCAPR